MRLTVTVQEALQMSGLGVTTLYKLMGDGSLETVKIGRRRLVKVDSLRALLEAA